MELTPFAVCAWTGDPVLLSVSSLRSSRMKLDGSVFLIALCRMTAWGSFSTMNILLLECGIFLGELDLWESFSPSLIDLFFLVRGRGSLVCSTFSSMSTSSESMFLSSSRPSLILNNFDWNFWACERIWAASLVPTCCCIRSQSFPNKRRACRKSLCSCSLHRPNLVWFPALHPGVLPLFRWVLLLVLEFFFGRSTSVSRI